MLTKIKEYPNKKTVGKIDINEKEFSKLYQHGGYKYKYYKYYKKINNI